MDATGGIELDMTAMRVAMVSKFYPYNLYLDHEQTESLTILFLTHTH